LDRKKENESILFYNLLIKPNLFHVILFFKYVATGKFAIEFYAVDIFIKAGGHIDKYASAVIIAIIQLGN